MKKIFSMVCMIVMLTLLPAKAANPYIDIGLKYAGTAVKECTLKSDDGFFMRVNGQTVLWIDDKEVKLLVSSGGGIDIIQPGNNDPLYTYEKQENPLEVLSNSGAILSFNDLKYRGGFNFLVSDGKITVINHLLMDDYLKGVISCEMISSWHIEALKAQAVASRGFALTNMNKFKKYGFNLDDTTTSQVYRGVRAEYPACTRAVEETGGKVPMYNGKPAQTIFFDSSGGKTENIKDVWGSESPYLVVVDDIYEEVKPWNVAFTNADIKKRLSDKGIDIGDVTDLEVVERSGSDRIIHLVIKGTKGTHELKREGPRTFFGLKSNLYTIHKTTEGGEVPKAITKNGLVDAIPFSITKDGIIERKPSTMITKDGIKTLTTGKVTGYEFLGKGFGHGVGMSQWGAKVMAEKGFGFEDIIKFYYPGVYLE